MSFCNEVQYDPNALKICEYIRNKYEWTKDGFDKCVPSVEHISKNTVIHKCEDPGDKLVPQQIYASAIEITEKEEHEQLEKLLGGGRLNSVDHRYFKEECNFSNPTLFDDLDPSTTYDEQSIVDANIFLQNVSNNLIKNNIKPNTDEYSIAIGKAIFDYIRESKGIQFDYVQEDPQKDPSETIVSGWATCIEFTKLYLALARQIDGFEAKPVWVYRDHDGEFTDHAKVAVKLNNNKVIYFDLEPSTKQVSEGKLTTELDLISRGAVYYLKSTETFFNQDSGLAFPSLEKTSFMSMLQLASHDYLCRADLNASKSNDPVKFKKENTQRALELSPNNLLAIYNMAQFEATENRDYEKALKLYFTAKEKDPFNPDVYRSISIVFKKMGNLKEYKKYQKIYQRMVDRVENVKNPAIKSRLLGNN